MNNVKTSYSTQLKYAT